MKHTPGPWTIIDNHQPVRPPSIMAEHTPHGAMCVCDLRYKPTREEMDANARLIAAAPDLAAVLRAYASLRKRWQDDDDFGTVEFLDALGDLQPQIAAALARLEGGAS